jgi:hypothetical protein
MPDGAPHDRLEDRPRAAVFFGVIEDVPAYIIGVLARLLILKEDDLAGFSLEKDGIGAYTE